MSVFEPASTMKKKMSSLVCACRLKKRHAAWCVCSCVFVCVCAYWLRWFGVSIVMGVVVDVGVVGSESVFVSPLSYSKLVIGEH